MLYSDTELLDILKRMNIFSSKLSEDIYEMILI